MNTSPIRFYWSGRVDQKAAWLVLALLSWLAAGSAAATTYVVFRYDDFAADKFGIRAFDLPRQAIWAAELEQDRLFAKHQMPYVVAVVPSLAIGIRTNVTMLHEDQEKVGFLKQAIAAGRMQVALHGFTHWNYSEGDVRRGEFRRADAQAQLADITAGRKILSETLGLQEITTFVPPFNGWNDHTAAALVRTGFTILSADRQWSAPPNLPLIYVPFTAQLWELESMVDRGALPRDSVIVVLYHPLQIAQTKNFEPRYYGLDKMAVLLTRLASLPDVKVVTFDQLRATGMDLSTDRYNASVNIGRIQSLWNQILPVHLLPGYSDQYHYQTNDSYRHIIAIWTTLTAATAAVLVLVGWLLHGLVLRFLPPYVGLLLSVCALLGFVTAGWLLYEIARRGFHPTSIRFFPPWLMVGWLLSALKHGVRRYRNTLRPSVGA